MLTAIVIDDEQLAREELIELINETRDINIIGEAENAIVGLKKINTLKPDIVFLDIQMPQVSGIELISMLDPDTMPYVVFITAFDQFAIQAFEDNAFDYLLKPIDPNRLTKTIDRLKKASHQAKLNMLTQPLSVIAPNQLEQIPCMGYNKITIIPTDSIESVFSNISGVHVKTEQLLKSTHLSLKTLEEKTPLLRCHRQYLVNIKWIEEIKLLDNGSAEVITRSGFSVPVSRRYLKILKEKLGVHN